MSAAKNTKRAVSPRTRVALIVAGLVVVLLAGFMLVVKPKRAEATRLDGEIAAVQAQIADKRAKASAPIPEAVQAADLFRLAKAMPDDADMAGVLLELNRVARETGIVFESISPAGMEVRDTYRAMPINLAFRGNFFALSDFLFRLRNLVRIETGSLRASGRLFGVKTLAFTSGGDSFPRVTATLTVDAFVYGLGTGAVAPPPPPPTDGTAPPASTDGSEPPAAGEPQTPAAPADAAGTTGGDS